jgi:hypothetical protein
MLDLVSKAYFSPERIASPENGSQDPRKGPVWKKGFVCYVDICSAFPGVRGVTSFTEFNVLMCRRNRYPTELGRSEKLSKESMTWSSCL